MDQLTSPTPIQRDATQQEQFDQETKSLTLYQFETCPFCVKVRREIRRLNLKIELRDVRKNKADHQELLAGGGQIQVPCLRITKPDGSVQWMYESDDINAYLSERFGGA